MAYSVIPSERFKKEAKRLIRRYPSLKTELADVEILLSHAPESGTPLGNGLFKLRIGIKSKGKGKSGGARIITFLITAEEEIYLLTIYDKSEMDTLDDKSLRQIVSSLDLTR